MNPARVLLSRVVAAVWHRRRERQLGAEIQAHLDHLADEYVRRGYSRREADAAARRDFGAVEPMKEAYRDQRGLPMLESLWQDARHALRRFRTQRGLVVLPVLTLGVGIAVSNAAFTIVNASCLRGLPIPHPDRVLFLTTRDAKAKSAGLSYADLEDLRRSVRTLAGLAAYSPAAMTLAEEGFPADRVTGTYLSAGAFALLGVAPAAGREFAAADERPGAPAVSIVSDAFWRSRFGADPSILGRLVRVNGASSTIVGVMPDGFRFPSTTDLWQPLGSVPGLTDQARDARTLSVYGRLRDETTASAAAAELGAASAAWPARTATSAGVLVVAAPINDQFNGRVTDTVWLAFLTAGVLVLVVACANVANLLLMRGVSRSREIAIRASLGGTRFRIARQLLIESVLLAVLGGIAGLILSVAGVEWLLGNVPSSGLPFWVQYVVDGRVLGVLIVACLISAVLFGLVPAVQVSGVGPGDVLKEGGRRSIGGAATRRWTAVFLAAEMALSIVLLANIARNAMDVLANAREDVPINVSPLLTASLTLPTQIYKAPEEIDSFYARLYERLAAIDDVASATITSALPFGRAERRALTLAGRTLAPGESPPMVQTVVASPAYFRTLGIALSRGRAFTDADGMPNHDVAIVNERLVTLFFPGEEVLGRQIQAASPRTSPAEARWLTVVGISPTLKQGAGPSPEPVVYLPPGAEPLASSVLVVRAASGNPAPLAPIVREAVRQIDPSLPLSRVMPMNQALRESGWNGRVSATIVNAISMIAFLMALVGLYAVTSHAAAERKGEIGVRVALGASPADAAWLVLRRASVHLGLGLAAGVGATYAFQGLFGSVAPVVMVALVITVAVMSAAACLLPAIRAARMDPATILRSD